VTEHLHQEELALRRLGATLEDRLRWFVHFAYRDLELLRHQEKVALGYDLRQAVAPVGWLTRRSLGPLPEPELRAVQRTLASGLRALVTERRDERELISDRTAGWHLPRSGDDRLIRISSPQAKRAMFSVFSESASEVDAIVRGVADLIVRAGERLRGCVECRRAFVARRRQAVYCAATCANKFRNRKKAQRRRKGQ
jgi:hypothetical protein